MTGWPLLVRMECELFIYDMQKGEALTGRIAITIFCLSYVVKAYLTLKIGYAGARI